MAHFPESWAAYGRLQQKLSTKTDIDHGAAIEKALNIILEPDYSVQATTEADFLRAAATAARQERHRAALRRKYRGELPTGEPTVEADYEDDVQCAGPMSYSWSLDETVHARRELNRLSLQMPAVDFALLVAVTEGVSYRDLARQHGSSAEVLRTRVARRRRAFQHQRPLYARICSTHGAAGWGNARSLV